MHIPDEERRKAEERYQDMCKRYGFQEDKLDFTNKTLVETKHELGNVKETLEATEEKMDVVNDRLEVAHERLDHVEEKLGIAMEIVVPKEQTMILRRTTSTTRSVVR